MLNKSADVVFPLFSPEGEKRWVPDWEYENILNSKDLCEDYIFLTKNHDHASTQAIWIVKRYVPSSYYIQFYKIEPNDKIGIITIQCTQMTENKTQVEVTYEYIGLSQKGNEFIKGFTSEKYKTFINEWEKMLLNYFNSEF